MICVPFCVCLKAGEFVDRDTVAVVTFGANHLAHNNVRLLRPLAVISHETRAQSLLLGYVWATYFACSQRRNDGGNTDTMKIKTNYLNSTISSRTAAVRGLNVDQYWSLTV